MNSLAVRSWQWLGWRLLTQWHLYLTWARYAGAVFGGLLVLVGGCASLPPPAERAPSMALVAAGGTTLAEIAEAALAAAPAGHSGLRLLPSGVSALEARLALIDAAERSVDAQYFLLADDRSGRLFAQAVCAAAARGVRVRLLIDDLHAASSERLLSALAAQPGVQLRLFNPLPVREGSLVRRLLLSLPDLRRIDRRMHNKLLRVDESFAIVGGRNIADAYFEREGEAEHFIDMDMLLAGPAVAELGAVFDRFWNSPQAWTHAELAVPAGPNAAHEARPAREAPSVDDAAQATDDTLAAQLSRRHLALEPAVVEVLADPPEAPATPTVAAASKELGPEGVVMRASLHLLRSARDELLMVSPYVVPKEGLFDAIAAAKRGGARVALLTNSLATTDEPLAHFGYARQRPALLRLGVGLHELMPPAAGREAGGIAPRRGSLGLLHAKILVVDHRRFFVGSMNLDRRSAGRNTELGLVVDSPRLAGELADRIRRVKLPASYTVRPMPGRTGLEWIAERGGGVWRSEQEPSNLGWTDRLRWTMLGLLLTDDDL